MFENDFSKHEYGKKIDKFRKNSQLLLGSERSTYLGQKWLITNQDNGFLT